ALEHEGVDPGDVADEAEGRVPGRDGDEAGVLARETDRVGTVAVDPGHHLPVDLADEGHADDVDRLRVGHPQAVDEDGLLAQAAHEVGALGTATVHDHRVHAHQAHEHDVLGEEVDQCRIGHGVAAVLDHHDAPGELPDVGQGLGQDG